jgi:hypothetical protein
VGWQTAIEGGSALLGGLLGNNAADAQQDAAQQQMDWIKQVYGDAQGNFAPYLGIGQTGVNGLQSLMGGDLSGFWNSPDNVAQREAMNYGMDHSAAARGRLYSGGYGADLSKAQGDLASQQLGNYRNSLFGLAGMGQNAASSLGGIGTATMGPMGQANGAYGDARASGYGAWAGMFGGLGNAFGNQYGGGQRQSSQSAYGTPTGFLDWMKDGY